MTFIASFMRSKMVWCIVGVGLIGYLGFLVLAGALMLSKPTVQKDALILELNKNGAIVQPSGPALSSDEAIESFLSTRFADMQRQANASGDGRVRTLLVITAPDDLRFKSLHELMRRCLQAGFTRFDLRPKGFEVDSLPPETWIRRMPYDSDPQPEDLENVSPLDILLHARTAVRSANGKLAHIVLATRAGETEIRDPRGLEAELRLNPPNAGANDEVHIMADADLRYGEILNLLEVCRRVGFGRFRYRHPVEGGRSPVPGLGVPAM